MRFYTHGIFTQKTSLTKVGIRRLLGTGKGVGGRGEGGGEKGGVWGASSP